MREELFLTVILLHFSLSIGAHAPTELSRCCSGGSRHFTQTDTCSSIKSEGTSMLCVRTASICCLRTLMDSACDEGAAMGRNDESCPTNINVLGGGLRKECCDCCLLAKDLVRRNEPCVAPNGFSAVCLRSFNKCCSSNSQLFELTPAIPDGQTDKPLLEGTIMQFGDRCSTSQCEHLCNDRGGDSVECSCRTGYDLAADGISCIDINECHRLKPPCDPIREYCINTKGAYRCKQKGGGDQRRQARPRMGQSQNRTLMDNRTRNSQRGTVPLPIGQQRGLMGRQRDDVMQRRTSINNDENSILSTNQCPNGFTFEVGKCIDVDECQILMDNCLESQRCLNTPGSFKCIRTLSCGTGYAMDDHEECMDVDECNLGSHDCGALYQCRNTQGSYRCDPKRCGDGELQNPVTGECTSIECPTGYYPKNGRCHDIDECANGNGNCQLNEECVNTPGSFRCQQKGNICAVGYQVSAHTGFCEDVDECLSPNSCGHLPCINLPGSFKCRCSAGYEFDERTKRCEDIDECAKFEGHVCDVLAICMNTIGSFQCKCKTGFQLASDGRKCIDVDECSLGIARCEQKCVNIPGSYQCICERGYALGTNGVTCEDIDECSVWESAGNELCMGGCINTPGAYQCNCPHGYTIQGDGRTCVDIDECSLGECQGSDRICVNTLGQYKCHRIECPNNYVHDKNYKNRCNRLREACEHVSPSSCQQLHPVHITWQFIGLPKNVPITHQRPSVTLFTIKGPSNSDNHVQFELVLKKASPEGFNVIPAVRSNFLLQKGKDHNTAIVTMRDSLDGPQMIELQLILRLTRNEIFAGKYVANLIIHISNHEKRRNPFLG